MAIAKPPATSGKGAARGGAQSATLRRAAGEVLMVGLQGPSLSATEAAWLKLIRPGGIILFRRNIETPEQTHALLTAASEARSTRSKGAAHEPLLRSIDVEGGTVDRLRDLIAPMPAPLAVAATRKASLFAAHGRLIGRELRLLGLNVTLAPVLDLRTAASSSVLSTRAVSSSPADVIEYATGFLKGLSREGVLGCGKHFPGLGSGQVDSHHSTPEIDRSLESLWNDDLLPYRRLARELALVMVSHARFPLTPSAGEPASISRFWITQILGKKIGFRGLVVSDDMEMGGILSHTALADATIRALLAGTHIIEICANPAMIFGAFEALLAEAESSPAFGRKLLERARHVQAFKKEHLQADRLPKPPSADAIARVRAEIVRFAEEVGEQEPAQHQAASTKKNAKRNPKGVRG
jgi:beta-N-acetylhexosaminidase